MASALLYVGSVTSFLPYARQPKGKGISAFRVDLDSGKTEALGVTEDIVNPTFAAVAPDGLSLTAGSELAGAAEGQLSAYAVDRASGALRLLSRQSSGGYTPAHLGYSPDGRFVAIANYDDIAMPAPAGAGLAIFARNADGSLGPMVATAAHEGGGPDAARQDRPHLHCARFTPDGQFVFVADLGIDRVVVYRFDGRTLTRQAEAALPPGSGPRHFVFPPSGAGLYVINELSNTVVSLGSRFELKGEASLVPPGFAGTAYASALAVSPDGKHLFAAVRVTNEIVRLDFDADGVARAAATMPCGGDTPRDFAFDPSGRVLAVANQASDVVTLFRYADGGLTALGEIATGTPTAIAFHPVVG